MVKSIKYFSLVLIIVISGCSKKNEPPIHPSGWLDNDAEHSHVAKIIEVGIEGCRSCHGDPNDANNYYGGSSGISCYQCHEGGPSGHPAANEWISVSSENFHGIASDERGMDDCQRCHGDPTIENDFSGGVSEVACNPCHTSEPSSHADWGHHSGPGGEKGRDYCLFCHGENFDNTCSNCHSSWD